MSPRVRPTALAATIGFLLGGVAIAAADDERFAPQAHYGSSDAADAPTGGSINVSGFAYRDHSRDGDYTLNDTVMTGVRFVLVDDDGDDHTADTNNAGFANFTMSNLQDDAEIDGTGHYRLVAVPPPGHTISSGNAEQTFDVEFVQGAIGDLAVDPFPEPVGIKPKLAMRAGATDHTRQIHDDGGDDVVIDERGAFDRELSAGDYAVTVDDGDHRYTRTATIESTPVHLSRIPDIERQADRAEEREGASPLTLHFDDLLSAQQVRKVPGGYGGIAHWGNLNAMHNQFTNDGVGYRNTTQTGHVIAYGGSGHPIQIADHEPFDLMRVHLGTAWPDAEGQNVTITAYADGERRYRDEVALSAYGAVAFQADYLDIDEVHFETERYWQLVMDNLVIRR